MPGFNFRSGQGLLTKLRPQGIEQRRRRIVFECLCQDREVFRAESLSSSLTLRGVEIGGKRQASDIGPELEIDALLFRLIPFPGDSVFGVDRPDPSERFIGPVL